MSVRAIVREGRLVLDEPTALPEGTVVDLDDAERLLLHEQLRRSWDEAERGETVPAEEC